MSGAIRLVVLGSGFSRGQHLPSLKRLGGQFQVIGVFSRSEHNAREAAALLPGEVAVVTDLEQALSLDGVEAVDVALPILIAADTVESALARGLHVFSEKPISGSVERGRELIAGHADRPDLVWTVAENFRFWPAALRVRDLVASGEIGTPLLCHFPSFVPIKSSPFFTSEWRRHPQYDGGFLLDGGVHDIAALRLIFGEVKAVSASMRSVDPELPPFDTLVAAITFDSGVVASYSVSYALDELKIGKPAVIRALVRGDVRAIRERYGRKHILGTRGSIFFMRNRVELVRGMRRTVFRLRKGDVMAEQFREFHAAVRDRRPMRNTPLEALRDLEVVEALLAAARQRTAIRPGGSEPAVAAIPEGGSRPTHSAASTR